jgi:hypothetical protein
MRARRVVAVMGMTMRVTRVVVMIMGMCVCHGKPGRNANENRTLQGATDSIYVTL